MGQSRDNTVFWLTGEVHTDQSLKSTLMAPQNLTKSYYNFPNMATYWLLDMEALGRSWLPYLLIQNLNRIHTSTATKTV